MIDIILAVVLLPLLLPIILVIALISLLMQGRPVFFRQRRVGRNFEPFDIYKFRTMTIAGKEQEAGFDAGNRSRITPLGRLLRKSKLDELPQIFNILGGQMAFVGPRPEVPEWVEAFRDEWTPILSIRPGITDPASIEFRNEEEILARVDDPGQYYRQVILPRKLALYKSYLDDKSLLYDLRIMLKTLAKVAFPDRRNLPGDT